MQRESLQETVDNLFFQAKQEVEKFVTSLNPQLANLIFLNGTPEVTIDNFAAVFSAIGDFIFSNSEKVLSIALLQKNWEFFFSTFFFILFFVYFYL